MTKEKGRKKARRKTETICDNQTRVNRLEKAYEAAKEEWEEFYSDNEDIFDEAKKLAYALNQAADELKRGVRETGISAGPMDYTKQRSREFNGETLYDILDTDGRTELRDEVVSVVYKVNTDAFDRAVQGGQLTSGEAQKAVKRVKEVPKVLHAPKDLNLEY